MWGKSRSKKRSQAVNGIINFFLSSRNPCFFLHVFPVSRFRMLAMFSTEIHSSICPLELGGTNLTLYMS